MEEEEELALLALEGLALLEPAEGETVLSAMSYPYPRLPHSIC